MFPVPYIYRSEYNRPLAVLCTYQGQSWDLIWDVCLRLQQWHRPGRLKQRLGCWKYIIVIMATSGWKRSLHLKVVAPAWLSRQINQAHSQQIFHLLPQLFHEYTIVVQKVTGPRVVLQHKYVSLPQKPWKTLSLPKPLWSGIWGSLLCQGWAEDEKRLSPDWSENTDS